MVIARTSSGWRRPRPAGLRAAAVSEPAHVVAVAVLAVAVLAAAVVGCGSDKTQAPVSEAEKATIDEFVATHLSDDWEAMRALYTENAILDDYLADPPVRKEGDQAIADYASGFPNIDWQISGKPFKVEDYVVQPVLFLLDGKAAGNGVLALEFDSAKIKHLWVSVGSLPE